MANPNAYATATLGSITIGTWGVTSSTNANPVVGFGSLQAIALSNVFVTNTVTVGMPTVTASSFAGSAVGVTQPIGSNLISATLNGYANIMSDGMPGPVQTFVPSVRDIALGITTLITQSES